MAHRYASEAPKGSNARGGFVLEVEMVRGIRWMERKTLTGGEAARKEFLPYGRKGIRRRFKAF